jgi:hypothetical protein
MKNRKINKTDIIISEKDTLNEMLINEFKYKKYFEFLCTLIPERNNERIIIKEINEILIHRKGVLYIFLLNNRIIKVGSSTVSFKERVSSYNCGRKKFRKNGTCSTTNYLVLQSLLNINKPIFVYAHFPNEIEIDVWGTKEIISIPTKRFEKMILTELKSKNKLPILCTQQ